MKQMIVNTILQILHILPNVFDLIEFDRLN